MQANVSAGCRPLALLQSFAIGEDIRRNVAIAARFAWAIHPRSPRWRDRPRFSVVEIDALPVEIGGAIGGNRPCRVATAALSQQAELIDERPPR